MKNSYIKKFSTKIKKLTSKVNIKLLAKFSEKVKPIYFDVEGINFKLRDDPVIKLLFAKRRFKTECQIIKRILKEGNYFIDVGANIGQLTLKASQICKSEGKVISIEPNLYTYQILLENINFQRSKSNIMPLNIAISDTNGNCFITNQEKSHELNYINKNDNGGNLVSCLKIDSLDFLKGNKIKILKIDTEGHDMNVLRGAKELILNTEYLIIELNFDEREQCLNYLSNKGFNIGPIYASPYLHIGEFNDVRFKNGWTYLAFKESRNDINKKLTTNKA